MAEFQVESTRLREDGPRLRIRVGPSRDAPSGPRIRVPVEALIDTGSGRSLLHPDVIRRLNLDPVGTVEVDSVTSNDLRASEYDVRLWLTARIGIPVRALATPLPVPKIRAVIGRDALARLRFEYDGPASSFRLMS